MKIYTKTGDTGETGLFGGKRVPKNHLRLSAYGTIDELNSHIGFALSLPGSASIHEQLETIQHELFTIGSHLATPYTKDNKPKTLPTISPAWCKRLEQQIDKLEEQLPKLSSFILPGGTAIAAELHICRTVCRRVERLVVELTRSNFISPEMLQYLNRLSDFFFVLARYSNYTAHQPDILWRK